MAKWSRSPELAKESQGLALTAEEGFVLSRLDTALTRNELVELTGLSCERVDNILSLLDDKGLAVSDVPSMRPAAATIPDADFEDQLPGDFVDATASPPSVEPASWSEPRPAEQLELDPNVLDPTFQEISLR